SVKPRHLVSTFRLDISRPSYQRFDLIAVQSPPPSAALSDLHRHETPQFQYPHSNFRKRIGLRTLVFDTQIRLMASRSSANATANVKMRPTSTLETSIFLILLPQRSVRCRSLCRQVISRVVVARAR